MPAMQWPRLGQGNARAIGRGAHQTPGTSLAWLARPQSDIGATGSPHFHGCDTVGLATGASFRRGERTLLSGYYFAAEIASPAGDRWNFGRRRLIRHTRTTQRKRFRFIPFTFAMDVACVHVRTPGDTNRRAQTSVAPSMFSYREMRQAGSSDQEAHEAAVAAVLSFWPSLTHKEASAEAVNAIAYATKYHSEWFWRGALQIRKWRGTTH